MPSTPPAGDDTRTDEPSRTDRARSLLRRRPALLAVPAFASLLSLSSLARALSADGGGGVTLPMPAGLPTLWTYVSLPPGTGVSVAGGLAPGLTVFFAGTVITGTLEAGLVGTLNGLADDRSPSFPTVAGRYATPIVLARLFLAGVVFAARPVFAAASWLAVLAAPTVVVVSYALYGLPFVVVTEQRGLSSALRRTLALAVHSHDYLWFALGHLAVGAVVSLPLSALARSGVSGVLVALVVTAPVGVLVAAYGVVVFRNLS